MRSSKSTVKLGPGEVRQSGDLLRSGGVLVWRALNVALFVMVLAVGAWFIWAAPQCGAPARWVVTQANDGRHCLATVAARGGFGSIEGCFDTKAGAEGRVSDLDAGERIAAVQCSARLEDHMRLGPLQRLVSELIPARTVPAS